MNTMNKLSIWKRALDPPLHRRAIALHQAPTNQPASQPKTSSICKREFNRRRFCPIRLFSIHFYYYLLCFATLFFSLSLLSLTIFFLFVRRWLCGGRLRLFVVVWFTFCLKRDLQSEWIESELKALWLELWENGKCTIVTRNLYTIL